MERMLKQQFFYRRLSFANQGKQPSVFRLQTGVCSFRFPFAENKRKLLFSVSSVFCLRNSGNMEVIDIVTWRWRHGNMETWGHQMETEGQAIFLICYNLLIVEMEVYRLSVCYRSNNRIYPFANG
jgi:hypothetical protein